MTNKKLTSIEWLEIKFLGLISFDSEELRAKYKEIIKRAKEKEKEQIVTAYQADMEICSDEDAEQYYNETYNN